MIFVFVICCCVQIVNDLRKKYVFRKLILGYAYPDFAGTLYAVTIILKNADDCDDVGAFGCNVKSFKLLPFVNRRLASQQ